MTQALSSNLNLPLSYGSHRSKNFRLSGFLHSFKPCNNIKAMAGDARDNLEHVQKPSSKHQSQSHSQTKRRVAPVAPVGLWDRFPAARTVQQMMETMERMMEEPFGLSGGYPMGSESGGYRRGRTPWEIKEGGNEYKMRFDMPGMTKEDVNVWVEEKMLVVKAAKKNKNGQEDEGEEWSAKSYGRYSSRIALPENVQYDRIKAEVKDGVLYITIPKPTKTSSQILNIHVQ